MYINLLKVLRFTLIILCILSIVVAIILGILYKIKNKKIEDNIEYVYNIYNENESVEQQEEESINNEEEFEVDIEYNNNTFKAVGILEIPKIEFRDVVLDGTSLDVLENGIGLFEHSPISKGNVCLAGHNTQRFLKRLNELEIGDVIYYISSGGQKMYKVSEIKIIDETDWSMLDKTEDNRITIITCVKNTPGVRLCVQGIESL